MSDEHKMDINQGRDLSGFVGMTECGNRIPTCIGKDELKSKKFELVQKMHIFRKQLGFLPAQE